MKLNVFQTQIIQERLNANGWIRKSPKNPKTGQIFLPERIPYAEFIKNEKELFVYEHQDHIYGDQDIIIWNKELCLGHQSYDLYTWQQLLNFIELKLMVIYKAPITFLGER